MIVSVKHKKTVEQVRKDIESLGESMNMRVDWSEDSRHASGDITYSGVRVPGSIDITETAVTLSVTLPLIARMRTKQISKEIENQLQKALS